MSVLLLVDVDNVIGGNNPRPELVEACLVELIATVVATTEVRPRVAAGYRRVSGADRVAEVLTSLGVHPLPAGAGRDAADHVLKEWAAREKMPTTRFFVASADRTFASLSDWGSLEVIVWQGQPLSTALDKAALRVHRVHKPGQTPRSRAELSSEQGSHQVAEEASHQNQSCPKPSTGEAAPTVDDEVAVRIGAGPEVMRRLTRSAHRLQRVGWLLSVAYAVALSSGTVGFVVEYLLVGEQALAGYSHLVFFVVFMTTISSQYVYLRASTNTRLATALLQGMTALVAATRSNTVADLWEGLDRIAAAGRICATQLDRQGDAGPHHRLAARRLGGELRLLAIPDLGRDPKTIAAETLDRITPVMIDVAHRRWVNSVPTAPSEPTQWQREVLELDQAPSLTRRIVRIVALFGVCWLVVYIAWSAASGQFTSPVPQFSALLALVVLIWAGVAKTDQLVTEAWRRLIDR